MLARLPTTFCNLYYQETVAACVSVSVCYDSACSQAMSLLALDPHLALNLEKALLVPSLGHVNGTLNGNFALEFP